MKLLGVEAIDIAGVANGVYSFADHAGHAHDRVSIRGGPGAGKTRLLQLILAAREVLSTGIRDHQPESFIRPGNRTAKVILSWELTAEEQTMIGSPTQAVRTEVIFSAEEEDDAVDQRMIFLLERYGHDDETPKVEYFSARRRLDVGGGDIGLSEEEQFGMRTDPSPRKFAWIPTFLEALPDMPERAARFGALLERFSPSCLYDAERGVLTSRGRVLRGLGELTASEADSVMFAATAALVGLSGSIVLVDQPELHGIPPVRALAGLSALGSDNQLIVAAPSPAFAATFGGAVVDLGSGATH
jgi:hypothetical protein